ncbi:translocation/assembly module TamB domain-containing protein [Parabacteroides bouchesdurhonensis]|uniref:translocation/assembly module TamB domain-containing protein n=1 Tax=Parabacteroides bouchesdurhonensis TaxID=1936995 RepID=UPI000E4F2ED5|nr:translocation/assembly module TamB domain-containing protein [Parabacteroides bouchesdurhonensis]RHJ92961.1 hypothetical protein DW095_06290 [Bacteroides sp. AM07-16]
MKKWIKRIGILCLLPIALVLLLSILLYIPPFQDYAISRATHYAGEATGMQISIKKIRLSFPLNLTVKGVEVVAPTADTLLALNSLRVSIRPLPLLKKEVLVDAIDLHGVEVNTGNFISGMEIKGRLGKLYARADRIDLSDEDATLNTLELSDTAITLFLNDTTSEKDTSSTSVNWRFRLNKIALDKVTFGLQMPGDSLRLATYIDKALLSDGSVDLGTSLYSVRHFNLSDSQLNYDSGYGVPTEGLDPSHIALNNLTITADSLLYQDKKMNARLREFRVEERSGLAITELEGTLHSDTTAINVPGLVLKTAYSEISLQAHVPWSTLNDKPSGSMKMELLATLGKEDLFIVAGNLPADFKKSFPEEPLTVEAKADGNLSSLYLRKLDGELPGAFNLQAAGDMKALTDNKLRSGQIKLLAETGNLGFIIDLLSPEQRDRFAIPKGIKLNGIAMLGNGEYSTRMRLTEGDGKIDLNARYNPGKLSYAADMEIDSLQPVHFMPKDSLLWFAASVKAKGMGTDIFSESTWSKLDGKISDIRYGTSSVSDVTFKGELEKNSLKFDLLSKYPLAKMDVSLNASLHKDDVRAMLIADVENFDLYGMHLIANPLSTSFQLFAEAHSNLDENNDLDISLGNWELVTPKQKFRPKMLTLKARSNIDTTQVSFHAGDLALSLTGSGCIHEMTEKLTMVSDNLTTQLRRDSTINLAVLRPLLPDVHLEVTAGQDNPIFNYLQNYYVEFNSLTLNAYTSPETGFCMDAGLYGLARDTSQLDTIRATVYQDSLSLIYHAEVVKNKYRKQQPFTAGIEGKVSYMYGDITLYYKDGQGKPGLLLGLKAHKIPDGIRLHMFPDNPIIAFTPFRLNSDNYIVIKSEKDIAANLRLSGDNNAALWIHSSAEDEGMEEVHAELNQVNLDVISGAFTYLPPMKGILNADFQYAPSDSAFMVVADVNVDDFYYENDRVGELMFNAVYLPMAKGNHQVDMHFFRDREEVTAATAFYTVGTPDIIAGNLDITHLPLEMLNPFIPDDMAKLSGALNGQMSITGSSDKPDVNGFLQLDTTSVFVGAVGSSFRFDDGRINVKDNLITFDDYNIYGSGKNPFVIDGTIDFHRPERMMANLRLRADNMQLLNVKRNDESLVYGKLFVNLDATAKGPLDALTMRGDLQLLGNTNVTYVLQDSPLTAQDRMSDMVTFVSFADTVRRRTPKKPPLPLGGIDMLMTVRIDPAVQLNVDLTPDQSSHVNLEGGGDLSFQYTPQGDMILNGRYTLSGGTVKYSLPVIPLKEFNIQQGSYVQWTGDLMDPTLNVTATERVRTSVSLDGQSPRMVNFDVGIMLKQRLENLGLQFVISAPEDMAVQEQLTRMGPEEQQKQAVSMIITGMYLAGTGGGKTNMNMGSALNSFLQSEINNIAGSALKSVDISFGMESYDEDGDNEGGKRTDYSFSFAKRFYNDRIRVVLGGRISTGGDVNNGQAQPFIDNISVEYRLDTSGSRYVKLFYDKNYESLLEGEITETGAGIVLRKKMMHLRELFNFRKNKLKPVNENKQ